MREDLVPLLQCPETGSPLGLRSVTKFFELNGSRHLVEGMLEGGGRLFPILDEIPRLLPKSRLSPQELAVLEQPRRAGEGQRVEPEMLGEAEVEAEIRRRMEKLYRVGGGADEGARKRCEGEIRYMKAEMQGRNKKKYVQLLAPRVAKAGNLLEIGGNFPGLTRNLAEHYQPSRAVVANLQILFPMAFKTPGREIDAVRADVQMLPFKDKSFELLATAFTLEHVPDWRAGLANMLRVGEKAFIAFGPNSRFPFEVGHLDAPLAGTLPKPLAAYAAWLFKALTGKRRSLKRIREILGEVYHVASPAFAKECRRLGRKPENLFPDLVEVILKDPDAPATTARKALKRHPTLARVAAKALRGLGMEPQMYYLA
jgi:ubiquinone/menaquinone biosynthesis C-methylase UbiE/uncharacterized protein YbaR (Trm112 family)